MYMNAFGAPTSAAGQAPSGTNATGSDAYVSASTGHHGEVVASHGNIAHQQHGMSQAAANTQQHAGAHSTAMHHHPGGIHPHAAAIAYQAATQQQQQGTMQPSYAMVGQHVTGAHYGITEPMMAARQEAARSDFANALQRCGLDFAYLFVPAASVGAIIGAGGSNIRTMSQYSGATIYVGTDLALADYWTIAHFLPWDTGCRGPGS